MNFKEKLETLKELENFGIEIILLNRENYKVENVQGKQGSLRVLQNHLNGGDETSKKIDLSIFCEFFDEWKSNKNTHPTISFLDLYNQNGGLIKKII